MNIESLQTGNLYIESIPSGAKIYINDVYQDKITPLTISNLSPGNYAIKLILDDIYQWIGTVTVNAGWTTFLRAILIPVGNLEITSNPEGARIYIDDIEQIYITPATITNISSGVHTYILSLQGYEDVTGTFTIIPGQTTSLNITLVPLLETGNLYVESIPSGAKIYINDIYQDKITPATISNLSPGNYIYKLTLNGYEDAIGTFIISSGRTTTLNVVLTPLPLLDKGHLYITSTPLGARIYIDNIFTGYSTPATIYNIPVGEHTYTLKLENYNDYIGRIYIPKDILINITATLTPAKGCILFDSFPVGADLIIEGFGRKFTTPTLLCGLPLGKLQYHMRLDSYDQFNGCVTLFPSKGENIFVVLVKKK